MADKAEFLQAINESILDADSLERFINGDDTQDVLTRLSKRYPTLQKALKQMFENGGLPATPFKTKAFMTASSLVDGKYAVVTDDTVADNNGLYVKTAGAWVKSTYDTAEQVLDVVYRNDASKTFDQSFFSLASKFDAIGVPRNNSTGWKTSPGIPVKVGDEVEITTVINEANAPYLVVWNSGASDPEQIERTDTASTELRVWTHTITRDGNLISQHSPGAQGAKIVINRGAKVFLQEEDLQSSATMATKADKVYKEVLDDFEMGYVDESGAETDDYNRARTIVYKLRAGDTLLVDNRSDRKIWWAYSVSSTPLVPPSQVPFNIPWYSGGSPPIVITADKPYIRFYFRRDNDTSITIDSFKDLLTPYVYSDVVYKRDIPTILSGNTSNELLAQDHASNYRNPSLATGGVISFTDDDAQENRYTELYPFILANDVPFGIAVVTSRIGKEGIMTTDQLMEMAANKKYIEILSHSHSHIHTATDPITDEDREREFRLAKEWLNARGMEAKGFVYPFGNDDANLRRIAQKYHVACYDYTGVERVETFDTIKNSQISRIAYTTRTDRVSYIKGLVDQAIARNGWLNICTHAGGYEWDDTSYDDLKTIIDYIKMKGVRIMLPSDAFQIFGNIVENDSGFKIQANGKIVGATIS